MPRYYFHYRDAQRTIRDPRGEEHPDLASAMEEGRLSARELLALDHGDPDPSFEGGAFEIALADDVVVGLVSFEEASLGPEADYRYAAGAN
jgi:hypothetical protein